MTAGDLVGRTYLATFPDRASHPYQATFERVASGTSAIERLEEMFVHGGTVSASSEGAGCGSTFTVHLPLAPTEAADAADPARVTTFVSSPGRRRVLVVDDNEDAAVMLAELLEAIGFETRTAYDGPSALATLDSFEPETAVFDIGLTVDFNDTNVLADPYPALEELRQGEPMQWNESLQAWCVFPYAAVRDALLDARLSSDRIGPFVRHAAKGNDDIRYLGECIGLWMVFNDPPMHTRLRKLASRSPGSRARMSSSAASSSPRASECSCSSQRRTATSARSGTARRSTSSAPTRAR